MSTFYATVSQSLQNKQTNKKKLLYYKATTKMANCDTAKCVQSRAGSLIYTRHENPAQTCTAQTTRWETH